MNSTVDTQETLNENFSPSHGQTQTHGQIHLRSNNETGSSISASAKSIDQAIEKSHTDNIRAKGQSYYKLAKIYYDKSELRVAEEFFLKALETCSLPKDAVAMMKITGFLVRIYSEMLKKEDATHFIEDSKEVLKIMAATPEYQNTAEYYFYAGVVDSYSKSTESAKENFQNAYKKAQEKNEPDVVAKSLLSLAQTYYHEKDYKSVMRVLSQLEQLLQIINKGYLKGSMYLLYGQVLNNLGDSKKSIDYYQLALKEFAYKSCWNLVGYIYCHIGIAYKKITEYKTALMFFDLATSSINPQGYKRLGEKISKEVSDVNDSNVDFFIDRHNRMIQVKELGSIDFKHRFVLLEILYLLAKNPGKFFDKEDLSRDIWKDEYNPLIHDKLIYTSISRLRKLVEPQQDKSKYIIRGKDGYTFSPQVNVRFYQGADLNFESVTHVDINSPL
ncbi:MAG: helix-turn-helix domain-containing protein [Bacteriovoracaceae bacterium]|nr:helix-turn-helix domain-containing protein [Bacteriovoracaceae bacterium]